MSVAAPPRPDAADSSSIPLTGLTPPRRRGGSGRFLTDVLLDLGFADTATIDRAIELGRDLGLAPERLLVQEGAITRDQLARAIADRFGLDYLDLGLFKVDMAAVNLLTPAAAKRYGAVPVAYLDDHTLLVAMSDPANVLAVDDIALLTRFDIRPAVASEDDLNTLITRMNRLDEAFQEAVEDHLETAEEEIVDLSGPAEDAPVIKLVRSIIAQAVDRGASDIHFEPQGEARRAGGHDLRVRMRVDGVLTDEASVPRRMAAGVISRIKIMSDLNIAERRLPQDGRVGLTIDGRQIDVRVVTVPSVNGESVVLRILDQSNSTISLENLGMHKTEIDRFRAAFNRPHGAVLVTGPTGSGKSTTLYAALHELNTPERNIITVEDPVEYHIPGITQVQVNHKAGLTFATGLRSMMRADPDVLMVGEIRDRETARIAVEGALTGHMVLSTLHTNDAPSSVTRLIEMGIEPFLVASSIDCVVAQRLARKLCPHCKKTVTIPAEVLSASGFPGESDVEAYEPVGCVRCAGLGYRGRVGLYEVMVLSEEIRELTLRRTAAAEIAAVAERQGMQRLREDGFHKVQAGITSIAEVARVT